MSTHQENRFIQEVETVIQNNPNIDMELINEWHKMEAILEKIPLLPTESNEKQQARLQRIPLRLFGRQDC